MLLLAYCAGLRRGELARLDLGDVNHGHGTITVRQTKFFKTRILPLPDSVMTELRAYITARRRVGASQDPHSALFWHVQRRSRYTPEMITWLLTDAMRRAGLKPRQGQIGPRVHDLRHSMVVNRILEWVPSGDQPSGSAAVPCDLPRSSGYQLHSGLHHGHAGPAASRKRAVQSRRGTMPQSRTGGAVMSKANPFPELMRAFFYEWLVEQRNASVNTVRSYRDTWRLFLRFVADRAKKKVATISLADLTAAQVAAFLKHAEHDRGSTIGTRNCRLAAIRSFFNFVATKDPASIAQCVEILNIPIKRAPVSEPCYLDPPEVAAILAQPDQSTLEGMRDHVLLSFLYNSGARIQEALDMCPEAIRFDSPSCVRVTGKGRKERICPLWPETVMLLRKLLERQPRAPDERLFVNRYGGPLSASGVRFKLAAYVKAAAETMPSLQTKHVTPHSFRHATAVHLVSAGVDVTVIRSWLGHVSLDTTNHYAKANLETKRKALEQVAVPAAMGRSSPWKHDTSLLAWLDTL